MLLYLSIDGICLGPTGHHPALELHWRGQPWPTVHYAGVLLRDRKCKQCIPVLPHASGGIFWNSKLCSDGFLIAWWLCVACLHSRITLMAIYLFIGTWYVLLINQINKNEVGYSDGSSVSCCSTTSSCTRMFLMDKNFPGYILAYIHKYVWWFEQQLGERRQCYAEQAR